MSLIDPFGDPRFTYLQVADDLADRIGAGEYPRKLPAERELARQYKVAYSTMRHAIKVLRDRELVISVHGRGTFATRPEARPASPPSPQVRRPPGAPS